MRSYRFHAALFVFFAVSLAATETMGQAWVQPRGSYYFKVSSSYLFTTEEFDYKGRRQNIFEEDDTKTDTSFEDISVTTYMEYGIIENATVVLSLPFKVLTSRESRTPLPGVDSRRIKRQNGNLSDVTVSVRTPIVRQPFAVAVQAGIKIPLGYDEVEENLGPPMGTSELDGEFHVNVGRSFHPLPAYMSTGIAYRIRGGELHDEVLFNVEGGYTLGRLFVKLRVDGLQNVVNPPDIAGQIVLTPLPGGGGASVNGVVVGDQDYWKLSPTVSYSFAKNFAAVAEIFHTLDGKNTVTGTTYSLGLVMTR